MWGMPITDWEKWGALVMAWAKNAVPRPSNVAELNRQMTDHGVGGQFSADRFHDVAFAQAPNETTVQIFLPTAQAIDRAIQRMQQALSEFRVEGIKVTVPFHQDLFQDEEFISGAIDTHFVERFLDKRSTRSRLRMKS